VKVEEGGREGKGFRREKSKFLGKEMQKEEGEEIWIHGSGII
jgi:hypothetical protein